METEQITTTTSELPFLCILLIYKHHRVLYFFTFVHCRLCVCYVYIGICTCVSRFMHMCLWMHVEDRRSEDNFWCCFSGTNRITLFLMYFLCMCMCLYIYATYACMSLEKKKGFKYPGKRVTDSCESPFGCREWNQIYKSNPCFD